MAQASFDRRRVNGPEESFPPIFEDEEQPEPLLSNEKRRDGRAIRDLRPIFLRTGLIPQANGSAYIETGNTKIACAVYGPRQLKNTQYSETGRLNVEVKFAPFSSTRRRAPLRDVEDRTIGQLVHQSLLPAIQLHLFPKSSIDVFITVVENDGLESCIASASMVASTALADAGIEMLGMVVACCSTLNGDDVWLDPVTAEVAASRGTLVLASLPALGTITNLWQVGQMSALEAIRCIDACQNQFKDLHDVVIDALKQSNRAKQALALKP
ncbi:ribosomal protein S5 domain 2-like protein [Serendipita vermifera]|nr:ribosomal protein S5 domain 2-like protein [Serendipita vermifera]